MNRSMISQTLNNVYSNGADILPDNAKVTSFPEEMPEFNRPATYNYEVQIIARPVFCTVTADAGSRSVHAIFFAVQSFAVIWKV